jgi:glycosyltransferase involved in cell wall biosynthesis
MVARRMISKMNLGSDKMSKSTDLLHSSDDESLVFSIEQIQYLREEFERQRKWVNLLSTREQKVLEELEQTKNSISYRIGRFLTWFPRTIGKKLSNGNKPWISHFVKIDEEEKEEDLFPSSLIISPELLPSDSKMRKADNLVEEILIAIRRGNLSVDATRDLVSEGSFSMGGDELFEAAHKIMTHLLHSNEYRPNVKNVYVGILRALVRRKDAHALEFGEIFYDEIDDQRAARTLIQIHGKSGNFIRPVELLHSMPRSAWRTDQLTRFQNASIIYSKGLKIKIKSTKKITPKTGAVLYHASQSRPHTSSGYAIRTHGLVSALKKHGVDIKVMLRHGYPLDRSDFVSNTVLPSQFIEDVEYFFSPTTRKSLSLINYQEVYNFNKLELYQKQAIDSILQTAKEMKPAIIHSASNFVVGMAGAKAAKALGIPSIYEIRGFWHLTQSTKREGYEDSDHFRLTERLEIETAKQSDYVFTITNALKEILVENGVDEHKISVLPNAVELEKFHVLNKNKKLEKELGFQNKIVIGYIGSFVNYEGLDLLLEACSLLYKKLGDQFRLLLVGDGAMMSPLRKIAQFLQIEDIIKFTGRIDHDDVQDYYSLIDIAPLPRKGHKVCELVSPLKPFEAMASGKVVITSSVKALAEIIEHGHTGLIFEKDNSMDLAEKLESVISNSELRRTLGANARDWVVENHSWEIVSRRVVDLYQQIKENSK